MALAKEGLEDTTLAPLSTQPKAMPSVALKAIVYKFRYAQTLEPWTAKWKTDGEDHDLQWSTNGYKFDHVREFHVEHSKELELFFTGWAFF